MKALKDKNKAGTSLEEYTSDWQTLMETLPYPVAVVDREFNVIMANRAMKSLCDRDDAIYQAKYYQLLYHSHRPVDNCPVLKTIHSGKSEQTEIFEPAIDKHFLINTASILVEGELSGVILSVMDITEQKCLRDDHRDLIDMYTSEINELKAREIKARKGKDAFLNMLEDINESYRELEDLFLKLVRVMVNALDAKSPWTKGHSERVSMYAELIASEMLIDDDQIKDIKLAGLLHDIGKIGTLDEVLDKPGRLTQKEFDIVKKHPLQGAEILKDIKQLRDIIPYIKYHHEKLDGQGYPERLQGNEIPIGARILHVADSFDSMTSDRPYRPSPGIEFALSELQKYKGTQFDHRVVDAFLRVLKKSEEGGATLLSE